MKPDRQEKVDRILQAAAVVLAEKGYENATIKDIAAAAHVNWGLLHYYFKNKEDLVVKTLRYASDVAFTPTLGLFSDGKSKEEIVDNAIELLKKTYRDNPGFYKLLFEMWCASGRSKKIKAELVDCVNRVIESLRTELEKIFIPIATTAATAAAAIFDASSADISHEESAGIAGLLLAMSNGLAFQLILDPQKLEDEKTWQPFRVAALVLLGGNVNEANSSNSNSSNNMKKKKKDDKP
jgi:AcrR family transcriptional regulator